MNNYRFVAGIFFYISIVVVGRMCNFAEGRQVVVRRGECKHGKGSGDLKNDFGPI